MGIWVKIAPGRQRYFKDEEDMKRRLGVEKKDLHFVQDDTMEDTWHPANGKYYNSKSKFREVTAQHGCVEIAGTNLNPGKNVYEGPSHYEIGKDLHDRAEAMGMSSDDIKRSVKQFLQEAERGRTEW